MPNFIELIDRLAVVETKLAFISDLFSHSLPSGFTHRSEDALNYFLDDIIESLARIVGELGALEKAGEEDR